MDDPLWRKQFTQLLFNWVMESSPDLQKVDKCRTDSTEETNGQNYTNETNNFNNADDSILCNSQSNSESKLLNYFDDGGCCKGTEGSNTGISNGINNKTEVTGNGSTIDSTLWSKNSSCRGDLTLTLADGVIVVHKFILVSCSQYFRAMLSSSYVEQSSNIVSLPHMELAIMLEVLRYIYTGFAKLGQHNVLDIFMAAHYFQVQPLTKLCCSFLRKEISLDDCLSVCTAAKVLGYHDLAGHAMRTCMELINTSAAYPQPGPSVSLDAMMSFVRHPALPRTTGSRALIVECVKKWADYDPPSRYEHLTKLLSLSELCMLLHLHPQLGSSLLPYDAEPPPPDHCCSDSFDRLSVLEHIQHTQVLFAIGGESRGSITANSECFDNSKWSFLFSVPAIDKNTYSTRVIANERKILYNCRPRRCDAAAARQNAANFKEVLHPDHKPHAHQSNFEDKNSTDNLKTSNIIPIEETESDFLQKVECSKIDLTNKRHLSDTNAIQNESLKKETVEHHKCSIAHTYSEDLNFRCKSQKTSPVEESESDFLKTVESYKYNVSRCYEVTDARLSKLLNNLYRERCYLVHRALQFDRVFVMKLPITVQECCLKEIVPRVYGAVAALPDSNSFVLMGGKGPDGFLSCCHRYKIGDNSWEALPSLPCPVMGGGAAAIDGIIYYVAGALRDGRYLNTLLRLGSSSNTDSSSSSWEQLSSLPSDGMCHVAVEAAQGCLYVTGGVPNGSTRHLNHCYKYEPATDTWTKMASMSRGRAYHGAAVMGDELYAIGGYDGDVWLSCAERYNPLTDTWHSVSSMVTVRSSFGVSVAQEGIYVMGGFTGRTTTNLVECFSKKTQSWQSRPSLKAPKVGLVAATLLLPQWRPDVTQPARICEGKYYAEQQLGEEINNELANSLR